MLESKELTTISEEQLLSREAIKLPPRERLSLLLNAKKYPLVRKRTSATRQIKEMIDLYNLCCLMLVQYFPKEQAEDNFLLLNFITSQETNAIATGKLAEAFKLLNGYEELERRITAIQRVFFQYQEIFPDLYQLYNLEDIAFEKISDIVENTKLLLSGDETYAKELLERWGII